MAQERLDVLSACASTGSFGDEPIQVNPESRLFPSAVSEAAILPNLCPISRPSEHSCSGRDIQLLHAPATLIHVATKDAAHESTRCRQRPAATNLACSQPSSSTQFIRSTRSRLPAPLSSELPGLSPSHQSDADRITWQNRFYSCTLDDVHLWRAMCYVEQNPVRAKMVRAPWRYPWSSAAAHVSDAATDGLLDLREWRQEWSPARWRTALTKRPDEEGCRAIRLATHRGRPLATDSFLSKLERKLGRRLRPLPVGRPKKKKPTTKNRKKDNK